MFILVTVPPAGEKSQLIKILFFPNTHISLIHIRAIENIISTERVLVYPPAIH